MAPGEVRKPPIERRQWPRAAVLSEHMMEFLLPGSPVYQLKLKDISETGAGAIVHPQSKLLALVQVGLELRVRLVAPRGSHFRPGPYRGRITQISDLADGAYKGHVLVGVVLITEG
jgi:hypothetical protein